MTALHLPRAARSPSPQTPGFWQWAARLVVLVALLSALALSGEPLTIGAHLILGAALVLTVMRSPQATPVALNPVERLGLGALISRHSSELIALIDGEGRYQYASPSHAPLLGYSPDELIGSKSCDLVHPDDRDAISSYCAGGPIVEGPLLCRVAHKSGEWRWLELRLSLIEHQGQRLALAIARDITALKEREATQDQARRALLLGCMAGGITHDINNLLTVVEASMCLAASALPSDHPAQEDLAAAGSASRRAAALNRRLLDFLRQRPQEPRPLQLGALIADLLPLAERIAGRSVSIHASLAPELWLIRADPGQIEQVLINLIANARDAMPEGGRLTISAQNAHTPGRSDLPPGDYVRLDVSDTGIGMSAEVRAQVFEMFFTTKAGGSGIGLASSQLIVSQLGGKILLASAVGQGSTFSVYLPRC